MPRIPYPGDDELDDATRELLASLPPFNAARMFAAAPTLLGPLSQLAKALLLDTELDPRLRELATLEVVRLTGTGYERAQHEALARTLRIAEGDIDAVLRGDVDALADGDARLVVRAAREMTLDIRAGEGTVADLLERLGRRATMELIVCVGFYNAVARILETTGVEVEAEPPAIRPD
jgi:alkylhydroperoxidase family enzyme